MNNRKFKSQAYKQNFTLKHLLSCTNQLGNLYEKYIDRITKVMQRTYPKEEYPSFLAEIYLDYRDLGVYEKWDLFSETNGNLILNEEISLNLYDRTKGMAGLTLEIVRDDK